MYTFILMLKDLIDNNNLHWFFVFFIFIFVRWGIVFFTSLRYKNFQCKNKQFYTSVIIPVVDEPIDVFAKVLLEISRQMPNEIIVVINGPENPNLIGVCRKLQNACNRAKKYKNISIKSIYTPTAFCGAERTPRRFRADAMQNITDALKRSKKLLNFLAGSLLCNASSPA